MENKFAVSLIGNPNCGKTTLFNQLTGNNQTVGNWPGVTVDKKIGEFSINQKEIILVDLPGVYSISPSDFSSEDEKIAREYILENDSKLLINIVDAANLERNLYLTMQLVEMKIPLILVVNMLDIAKKRKIDLNLNLLEKKIGCKVVPLVASKASGVEFLKETISNSLDNPQKTSEKIGYPAEIEKSIVSLQNTIDKLNYSQAVQLLEEDLSSPSTLAANFKDVVKTQQQQIFEILGDDADIFIADSRYKKIGRIIDQVLTRNDEVSETITDKIDKIVLNRFLGIPLFLIAMYFMFFFSINIGSAFIDFFDIFFGNIFVNGVGEILNSINSPNWLVALLANGIGGGIQTVSTFIPVIFSLYLFLSFLEDSGYMARAAFVMDRLMRSIGLPGKAFIPLIVGFGCNVPSIMATRTIENKNDRITTVMMSPFMSCGARLPVYVLFAAAFFPKNGQNLIFGLYILGILAAIFTGFLLKRTALKSTVSQFVMELPPYHIPTFKSIVLRAIERLKTFIYKAGKLIIAIVAILSILNTTGIDGTLGNDNTQDSLLTKIGQTVVPIFEPIGVTKENWPAAVGIFTGIFAKEAVVGTLDSLYADLAKKENKLDLKDEKEPNFNFKNTVLTAWETIPKNLAGLSDSLSDPLGINVGDLSDTQDVIDKQDINLSSLDMMQKLFKSKIAAFSYLLLVLFYLPCVAAVGAIWREVGTRWTIIAAVWTTGLGYGSGVLTYQIGTFAQNPIASVSYIAAILIAFSLFVYYLTRLNIKQNLTIQ